MLKNFIIPSLREVSRAAFAACAILAFFAVPTQLQAQDNDNCYMCHEDRDLKGEVNGRTRSVFVDEKIITNSVHGEFECTICHLDVDPDDLPHDEDLEPVDCGTCHGEVQEKHAISLHGKAIKRGDPLAPRCTTCHGTHNIMHVKDPASPVRAANIPFLCGSCHSEGSPVQRQRKIHQDHILENYSESIHGEGLLKKGLTVAATCISCHTAHEILPHTDPNSSIARRNIAKTCSNCHAQIEEVHVKVIKGELWEKQPHLLPACVDCHQPHKIRNVFYDQGTADAQCLECHQQPNLRAADGRSMFVNYQDLGHSRHVSVACSQCHSGVNNSHTRPCDNITSKVDCAACHAETVDHYNQSIHGVMAAKNDPDAPSCLDCHGTHSILGKNNPNSRTFPTRVPMLCGECHRAGQKGAIRTKDGEDVVSHYIESIHGKGLLQSGLVVTAQCTDCHTAHDTQPSSDPRSSVNHANVSTTCGKCHHGIEEQFAQSIHSRLVNDTDKELPTCNDCHSAHTIRRSDESGFKLEIMDQCGRCHEHIAETYFDTYHGKVSQLGYTKTAKCYDCHGAHDILPPSNPKSHLSHQNVVETCKKCHPSANRQFAGYLSHATHHDPDKYPYLYWAFWGMTILLIVTFILGGTHTILWLPRAFRWRKELQKMEREAEESVEDIAWSETIAPTPPSERRKAEEEAARKKDATADNETDNEDEHTDERKEDDQ
ncbi:hypothetical protein KQI65_17205 [bacterium]|nr:hypothetical protein [bacterium]